MLTQCPYCRTTFRVTREILRVADGQVRCGRCQTQFDALERLIEEQDDLDIQSGRFLRRPDASTPHELDAPSDPRAASTLSFDASNDASDRAPAGASNDIPDEADNILVTDDEQEPIYEIEVDASHEEITLEGRHIEISGTYQVIDDAGQGRLETREESFQEEWAEIDEPEPHAEDDLRSPAAGDALADDALDVEDEFPEEILYADDREADRLDDGVQPAADEDEGGPEPLHVPAGHGPDDEEDFLRPARPRRSTLPWKILFLPLILILAAQVIHDNRAMLARHPRLGAPLTEAYRLLGLNLQPEWDLHAYEVRQWGIVSDPAAPGTLRVRASIRNLAGFPQPYPLLKLVLEDRWGEQVGAREFEPAEYLDPNTAPNRLLAPAQTANATIIIVDPGPDAEGFHFDVCLRGPAGLACAADLPRH